MLTKIKLLTLVVLLFAFIGAGPLQAQVSERQLEAPGVTEAAKLGFTVSIEGDIAVVAAPNNAETNNVNDPTPTGGTVFVYQRANGVWNLIQTLLPGPPARPDFTSTIGDSVSISGNTLVTTGGSFSRFFGQFDGVTFVYVYKRSGNRFELLRRFTPRASNFQVNADSIATNGNLIVLGSRGGDPNVFDDGGAAYVFNTAGTLLRTLRPTTRAYNNAFGDDVDIDNSTIVVGAPAETANGVYEAGAAYVYDQNQGGANRFGLVRRLAANNAASLDQFGQSVAISADRVAVGSQNNFGSIYLFGRNTGGANNFGLIRRRTAPTPNPNVYRVRVGLSGERAVLLTDAFDNTPEQLYQFNRAAGGANNFGLVAQFTARGNNGSFDFGFDLELSNDQLLAGAPLAGGGVGAAFIYTLR